MKPKPYLRSDLPATSDPTIEQLYFYPRVGEMPSPMYEGLRTNLPYVRFLPTLNVDADERVGPDELSRFPYAPAGRTVL